MLKFNSLSKGYSMDYLFRDVSFSLTPGERLGLVGRNGTGKTTLFKLILGEEEPDSGTITAPKNYRIGHLSQHLKLSEDTVIKEALLGLPKHEDGIDETYKAEAILMGLGFSEEQFNMHPSGLSGGLQIRLNLARTLVAEPNLLLLDEPTNYLDIVSVRWLKKFLQSWKGELMLITHDREFMDSVTTHTMAIHRAKVKRVSGGTEKLYAQILLEEEVYEQTRERDEKKRAEIEKFVNRFRAKATKASAVQSRIKALDKMDKKDKLSDIRTLDFEFNSAPFMGKWLIEADGVSFGYDRAAPLIKGLSFSIGKEDRIAVIGKNGKGKTTLLNLLDGDIEPTAGAVKYHPNFRIAYFGQTNISRLDLSRTIEEELMSADPYLRREGARRIAGAMMFSGDAALKKISVLSGGERARVLLGKLLATPANLLLLDEPTNHLDMDSIDSLVEAIDAFDGAVVIVTHSELILKAIATKLIIFDKGSVSVFDGNYDDFLEKIGWEGESSPGPAKKKNGKANWKDAKKLRADVLSEKFRVLGPIKKEMSGLEDEITELERVSEASSRELLLASERGEADLIAKLSKTYHESRERIDTLFDRLESLTNEHDAKVKEFEERLGEIG
ncbi:MAG: ABC-F family ATP-binding cassette domain-containing protein [Deltaproteobacteria bacterium]|nr:ABC-F family ATP-binding cassette domain-containing protein [Deltaproteobacteria bacterium]